MWEEIDVGSDRLRVKNGWVVRSYSVTYDGDFAAIHQVFVHDEFGTWDFNNKEKLFTDKSVCKKCNNTNVRKRWHGINYGSQLPDHVCGKTDINNCAKEHIHYYCNSCLFDWTDLISGK